VLHYCGLFTSLDILSPSELGKLMLRVRDDTCLLIFLSLPRVSLDAIADFNFSFFKLDARGSGALFDETKLLLFEDTDSISELLKLI